MSIHTTVRRSLLLLSATALAATGVQGLASGPAGAQAPGSCRVWFSGPATGKGRCEGPASPGYSQFRITLTCKDGPTGAVVGGGTSAWAAVGNTLSLTCGAPQRQNVNSIGYELR